MNKVKCIECEYITGTGIEWDFHTCIHPACFIEKEYQNFDYEVALYGKPKTRKENTRITNYENLNKNNDCPYFKVKAKQKSWWKIW